MEVELESQRRHSKGNICRIEGQHYTGPDNQLLQQGSGIYGKRQLRLHKVNWPNS